MAPKCTLSVLHVAAGPSSGRLGTSNKTHVSLAMSCTYHVDVMAGAPHSPEQTNKTW